MRVVMNKALKLTGWYIDCNGVIRCTTDNHPAGVVTTPLPGTVEILDIGGCVLDTYTLWKTREELVSAIGGSACDEGRPDCCAEHQRLY